MLSAYAIQTGSIDRDDVKELTALSGIRTADDACARRRDLTNAVAGLLRARRSLERQLETHGEADAVWAQRTRRAMAHKSEQIGLLTRALHIATEMERRLPGAAVEQSSRAFILAARELLPPPMFAAVQRHALQLAKQALG